MLVPMKTLCRLGLPLQYVMGELEFFEDVLDNAAQLELTVMAMPVRPLPLAPLRDNLCQRLTLRLGEVCSPDSLARSFYVLERATWSRWHPCLTASASAWLSGLVGALLDPFS